MIEDNNDVVHILHDVCGLLEECAAQEDDTFIRKLARELQPDIAAAIRYLRDPERLCTTR